MIKYFNRLSLLIIAIILLNMGVMGQKPVEKTNSMKVYMHYMPWFETPATIGSWGWHWRMNTMNPDIIVEGKRQIAAHYYPLIGPYASRDKDVIEYHLLLMKLSGVDGVLINWYGVLGSNGDINDLLKSSNAIISYTDDFGMQFGVVMEDRFSRSTDDVKANLGYLQNNYFTKPEYIRYGKNNNPLLTIFGPITFTDSSQWKDMLPAAGDVEFLTLWNQSYKAGSAANGEYSWVYQDDDNHINHLTRFYTDRAPGLNIAMGSAYPGFNDFYQEGGSGDGYFNIPHYFGSTLGETLNKANEYANDIDMLQLVTFNDFGEGTIFEPTIETGFDYLKQVQEYTGVSYTETELNLVYRLYLLRKDYADSVDVQLQLDEASVYLRNLEIENAAAILNNITILTSLPKFKNDNSKDSGLKIYPNPLRKGDLNIEINFKSKNDRQLKIVDLRGVEIYQKWLGASVSNHLLSQLNLKTGVYAVIVSDGIQTKSTKLIIE